ncbi:hypothetical protein L1987_46160 [Smallanthus sonchifolius]|uniref:Uncharacterized protein n=1 Tax=Smallanthus sonchifolius TaxID=185202 RepID=A0ACB9G006_9ASTR|nr:hypothetical protein L1987_46160 [Smallanthus sonchifolius]
MLTQFSEAETDTDKGKNTSSYKEIGDDKNDVNKGDKSREDYDVSKKGCQTVKPDVHGDGTTEVNVCKHEDLMDVEIFDQIRQRPSRNIKLPDVLRSPFVRKKVSLVLKRSKIEDNTVDIIFAAFRDEWNYMFQTKDGATVPRISFETLYLGIDVQISVLKSWSLVLNSEEQYRNRTDPLRLFCSCNMLAHEDFDSTVRETRQVMIFSKNIHSMLKDVGRESLIGIELLFIPILHSKHYYVMCFHLKKAQIDVIDNLVSNADFNATCTYLPQVMQSTLCNYLSITSHPIADELRRCEPKRISLPWRIVNNSVDCGVFVMHHMETYKEVNLHKDDVESEVREYVYKKKLKGNAFERIKERVSKAF